MSGIGTKLALVLMACHCKGAELFKSEVMVGCWKVDASTARYYSSMTPNALPPSLPKGAERFGLLLNRGGSCLVSNAPADFLWYHSPPITNCAGFWVLSTKPLPPGVSFPDPLAARSATNGYARLNLALDLPRRRATFELPVIWLNKARLPHKRPAIIIGPSEGTNSYEWSVALSKSD